MGALTTVCAPTRYEPHAGGDGTPEAAWRAAALEQHIAAITPSRLVPTTSRVVVVAPHPDDEVLGTGGLLSTLALSRAVCVISVTDGEASHPSSRRYPAGALAALRARESIAGLAALGLRASARHPLHLPDGDVASREETLTEQLTSLLRPTDVVFATSAVDGHPDHDAVGRAARIATQAKGARLWETAIWLWHWASPDDPRLAWDSAVRLTLSPATWLAKRTALAAHRSQLEADPSTGTGPVLSPEVCAHFDRPFEVFFRRTERAAEGRAEAAGSPPREEITR